MSQKTYRIGEAAAKLKLKSYVLRFWETEFPQIAPVRTEKGQRLYRESDLAVLGRIRYLLHERGLTIDGARRLLREEAARGTLYTTAESLCMDPGDVDEEPRNDAGAIADTPGNQPRESTYRQSSLFPLIGNELQATFSEIDLQEIMTELATIRRLLERDTTETRNDT